MIGMTQHKSNVCRFRMTANYAEKLVHELAVDTANIIWRGHSEERSEERDISFLDALLILRGGCVLSEPTKGKYDGEWCCKIVKKLRGNRDGGVVTVIMTKQRKLKIVTVEWEDLP
jgi:hypothetical protein